MWRDHCLSICRHPQVNLSVLRRADRQSMVQNGSAAECVQQRSVRLLQKERQQPWNPRFINGLKLYRPACAGLSGPSSQADLRMGMVAAASTSCNMTEVGPPVHLLLTQHYQPTNRKVQQIQILWILSTWNLLQLRSEICYCVLQGRHNIGDRDLERDIIPMCREMGLGVAPWSVLGAGKFSGRFKRVSWPSSFLQSLHEKDLVLFANMTAGQSQLTVQQSSRVLGNVGGTSLRRRCPSCSYVHDLTSLSADAQRCAG